MSNKVYVHCPACGFGFVHMVENSGKAAGGLGGAAAGADEVLSTWSGCMGRGAGGLTSLRVSLAGRLPPREINALLGATAAAHGAYRGAVASTPGTTKHSQTLPLSDELTLVDCPGLVFPSFVSTREEMVVNGVLPIDQLRDHIGEIVEVVVVVGWVGGWVFCGLDVCV
jgi:hypothetical protein